MNRLWVRLSVMIAGVLLFVFFVQFLGILLPDADGRPPIEAGAPQGQQFDGEPPPAEIARRLLNFAVFSVVVGLVGGVVIARVISAPVSDLAKATRRVGEGELDARVTARGSRELIELAETFNKMAADLQNAETLRNNLMADVSHELRTPLTVLEGNFRAALDDVYALDEADIANLYGQTRHLIRLVNDLRELALAESHQLPLDKQPADLNALVTEILQALEPFAAEKGVELADRMEALPQVTIDTVRIRQVLFNLVTNALRHTPAGGEIVVSGRSVSRESVWRWRIAVRGWNRSSLPRSSTASIAPTGRAAGRRAAAAWAWRLSRQSSKHTAGVSKLAATARAAAARSL